MEGPRAIPPVYTLGASGRTPEELRPLLRERDALLLDIRLSPRSRWVPVWNKSNLASLLGDDYRHVPELGNVNYKGDGPIQIADYPAGRAIIEGLSRPVVLLCQCKDYDRCHRKTVAELLRADGFGVEELPA